MTYSPWPSGGERERLTPRGGPRQSAGWRSSGTIGRHSERMVYEPVSARSSLASLSTPTTCKVRGRTTGAAFCAAYETHLAGVTDGAGGSTPRVIATTAPRPSRRVAHAPVSVSRSLAEFSSDLRAVCTCVVTIPAISPRPGVRSAHRAASQSGLVGECAIPPTAFVPGHAASYLSGLRCWCGANAGARDRPEEFHRKREHDRCVLLRPDLR